MCHTEWSNLTIDHDFAPNWHRILKSEKIENGRKKWFHAKFILCFGMA